MKTAKQTTAKKTAKSRPAPPTAQAEWAARKQFEVPEGKTVLQHDLKGFALICLPAQMRQILGEEACEKCVRQIQEMAMVLIVRELEKVLFVDLAFRVAEPGADGPQLTPVNAGDASPDKVKTKSAKGRAKPVSRKS